MSFRLGIDTGGTFTDAVLVDDERRIVAAEKSLTTRFDLSQGIGDVIGKLPQDQLKQVTMVSLSTTLTTNSVVEDLGAPVCVLLPGYTEEQIKQSGLLDILPAQLVALIDGSFDAMGKEVTPLDLDKARETIEKTRGQVSAFAISGMFGTRNSSHELQLKQLVVELSDLPVICGHELASSLGAPRRALTAALNARMVPPIRELIASVEHNLEAHQIDAPLMIVKGDGSLASKDNAIEKPIGTVLSGPAASVIGACHLSGYDNAIVADMGGTTTDIAVVSSGQPQLCSDGARIGGWQPMVEAVRVHSIGLGGDSEVRFNGHKGLSIGPRRVVPTSLLGHLYPEVIPRLQAQAADMANARSSRFVMRLENNQALINQLNAVELEAFEMLTEKPVELDAIVNDDRKMARALAKLQRLGLAIYSGFTPSDAVHVLGINSHWNTEAAELAAKIWMRQMRFLYGFGKWEQDDIQAASRQVYELVNDNIQRLLVEVGLNEFGLSGNSKQLDNLVDTITRMVTQSHQLQDRKALFHLDFAGEYPIIAVGAPAASYYQDVASNMRVQLSLPQHADVANAFGAVMGSVIQRAQITITQPNHGLFRLFHLDQPQTFDSLDAAKLQAETIVSGEALEKARDAGAIDPQVTLDFNDIHVKDQVDGDLFLESTITATAIGPACDWRGQLLEQ